MHTGLEEAADGFARMAAFYAERARGGVGLIVTGGIAPNFVGPPRAAARRSSRSAGRSRGTGIDHRRRARGGRHASRCRSCTRAATRITRSSVAPSAIALADQRRSGARALTGWGVRQHDRRLRALRASSRSAPATTASRSWAPRATSSTSSSRRTPTIATTNGAARSRTASAFPSRSCAARARRVGRDFIIIYRLSMLDLVDGGSTWDEVVALAQGGRGRRRDDHQHRHRLARGAHPDDRDDGAARGVRLGDAAAEGRRCAIPLIATNRINDPGGRPRRCSRAATPTWCRWRGRSSPMPEFVAQGGGRTAPTRSTPASAATRRASTRSSRARSRRASSIRTPATRRC